ncbi:flagellar assembly protein FliW [Blastococcus sp. MG754426]|uniref:flagellar assembly protein FliW n=1 Tax=unclassified Blastococcus TaxID=2619396 RepID=UPI001EEFA1D8|nr:MULTISPECIES: flagellar assembly protein FliW [unclassified Blastococcus]MCF6509329.1 flagellar assembly protein FliW [Blastococcus sp. MG754426]MCF6513869.1 flagellar assembly protein FliW [Blastococcus sp. MG754427]MCF6736706.1 flagellar assembly protein FliW [Blastococcus sp. KM273129]
MTAALADQPSVTAPTPPPVQVLSFTEPVPGFPGYRDYVLVAGDGSGLLFWLQAVAPDGPRFLAVPAGEFFPGYAPVVPAAVRAELGLADVADARVYCLVSVPGGDVAEATANLRAPVVVAPATHRARQVVQTDGSLPLRRRLRR